MFSRLFPLMLLDSLLGLAAFYTAALLRFGFQETLLKLCSSKGVTIAAFFALVSILGSQLMDVYDPDRNFLKREILINSIMGSSASFFILSIAYYLEPDIMMGRGILVISIILFVIYQSTIHSALLSYFQKSRFLRRVLVLGTGELAKQMGELAAAGSGMYTLAGYVSCDGREDGRTSTESQGECVSAEAVLGHCDDLQNVAKNSKADAIVVALTERRGVFPLKQVLQCKLNGLNIMDAPSFYEQVNCKLMLEQITPSWFIFSTGFRKTTLLMLFRRCSDILLAGVGLLLASPLFPLVALLIKLDSPGPLLFSQIRVGCGEKPFRLYKFRSMRQDAEAGTGAVWAQQKDPRVTRVGLFIRNTRIDEIPQLLNVLKGDMSFIGPRPERPEFVEKLKIVIPYYSKRHFVKPGVTGWAQVRYPYGASVEDAVEKLRYDLYYIKNHSFFMDALIFFETIKVVLFG